MAEFGALGPEKELDRGLFLEAHFSHFNKGPMDPVGSVGLLFSNAQAELNTDSVLVTSKSFQVSDLTELLIMDKEIGLISLGELATKVSRKPLFNSNGGADVYNTMSPLPVARSNDALYLITGHMNLAEVAKFPDLFVDQTLTLQIIEGEPVDEVCADLQRLSRIVGRVKATREISLRPHEPERSIRVGDLLRRKVA